MDSIPEAAVWAIYFAPIISFLVIVAFLRHRPLLAGRVSIGLATYSTSSALSLPLLKEMRARHPHIVLHVNDSFGHILSELIMTGKMDMALIYAADPIKGVTLQPLFREEMFLVSPPGTRFAVEPGQIGRAHV